MKATEEKYTSSYDGREGCLVILIAFGVLAAVMTLIGTIYLIFF